MVFIDSNIPMYLVGAFHPHKVDAQRLMEQCITEERRLVTDAEVFQEILHRYTAINRREAIQPAFEALMGIIDEVFAVELRDTERARDILMSYHRLSARDALHAAIMERYRITSVMSFDSGFDLYPGISRIPSGNAAT